MIALKLHSRSDFPVECMKYEDAATILHEKNEAYVGMSPGTYTNFQVFVKIVLITLYFMSLTSYFIFEC